MTDQSNRVPWPKIKTPITNNRQLVPLGENYDFSDMSYLDTNEAYPMFEKQADIIIEKKCKGIIDVGCRHGPVLKILHDKGYKNFNYMGFDTSIDPISIAQKKWKNFNNIEFRNISWDNKADISVDFQVDQVIWSGVLLYKPNNHFDFFKEITCYLYNSPNAIIQEPRSNQKYWDPKLILHTIDNELDAYRTNCKEFKEYYFDLEIFAGNRIVVDISI